MLPIVANAPAIAAVRPALHCAVPAVSRRPARRMRLPAHCQCKATEQRDRIAVQTIDDLDRNYCDEFVCESSPAVEQTIRAMARDLTRVRLTPALFQKDCTYTDGFRSFQGPQRAGKPRWYATVYSKPAVAINKMRMLDKGTAQIDWHIEAGPGGSGPGRISVSTTLELNQLTGRVQAMRETWDVSRLSPPAAAALTVGRLVWSLKLAASEASEDVSASLNSLGGGGGAHANDGAYTPNPTDPTRFFLNSGGNQQWNDMVSYATIAAFLYLIFRAFGELEKL